jgi:hypothetical protein
MLAAMRRPQNLRQRGRHWYGRFHDPSGRLVAAGRADGIADALRWVSSLTRAPLAAPIAYMRNAEDSTLHTLHTLHAVREKSRQHPQATTA